jgi:hypothetical protein
VACIAEGVVVLTFTLDPRCWWIVRSFARNSLIRVTDRVESLVVMFAVIVSLVAASIAGAVGTAVYGAAISYMPKRLRLVTQAPRC